MPRPLPALNLGRGIFLHEKTDNPRVFATAIESSVQLNTIPTPPRRMGKSPSIERIEAQALRRQLIAFFILTSLVIAALLLLHIHFASLLGEPSKGVILILAVAFSAKIGEWIWLWRQKDGISERAARIETAISMLVVFLIAAILAILTDRDDVPYFVLLAIPILQCAYRFGV